MYGYLLFTIASALTIVHMPTDAHFLSLQPCTDIYTHTHTTTHVDLLTRNPIDRFYIALVFALELTLCDFVAYVILNK